MASVWRIRTVFTGVTGSPWVSTAYMSALGSGTVQQAVTAVGNFWGSADSLMEVSVSWTTLADVEALDPATGEVTGVSNTTPATGGGVAASTGLPVATQGLVRWRTGVYVNGREIRGRWFIPGLLTTANNDGAPSSTMLSTLNTAASTLISDANSELVIWSRKNLQVEAVTSGTTWSQFAILRSRRD